MWTDQRAKGSPKSRPLELLALPTLLALLFLCHPAVTAGPPHSGMVLVLFPNNADESPGLRFSIRVSTLLSRPTLSCTSKSKTSTAMSRVRRTPINDGSRPSYERSEDNEKMACFQPFPSFRQNLLIGEGLLLSGRASAEARHRR
jgi:hypothetical protein